MLVGLSSPKPNCLYTEYGSRFTLAPKSNSALSMQVPPILTDIVGILVFHRGLALNDGTDLLC